MGHYAPKIVLIGRDMDRGYEGRSQLSTTYRTKKPTHFLRQNISNFIDIGAF